MSAPGWYPDPNGNGQRYFDGQKWTEHQAAAPLPAPAPKKSGPKINWAVLVVVLLFFGGCAVFSSMGDSDKKPTGTTGTTSQARATDAAAAKAGLGTEVRDGKFSFVVTDVSTPGNIPGASDPRGEWMVASMKVANIGSEPQSFFVQNQKLIDSAGREYAADTMAAYSINPSDTTMVMDLGPGFSIDVKVPFDVPPGTKAAAIVVHDSAFSGGATVNVS
jgi:hypothetical protein